MAKSQDAMMALDDLAAYTKVSESSLYKLCQAGKVPGTKVGRRRRFHEEAIDAWIRDGVSPNVTALLRRLQPSNTISPNTPLVNCGYGR